MNADTSNLYTPLSMVTNAREFDLEKYARKQDKQERAFSQLLEKAQTKQPLNTDQTLKLVNGLQERLKLEQQGRERDSKNYHLEIQAQQRKHQKQCKRTEQKNEKYYRKLEKEKEQLQEKNDRMQERNDKMLERNDRMQKAIERLDRVNDGFRQRILYLDSDNEKMKKKLFEIARTRFANFRIKRFWRDVCYNPEYEYARGRLINNLSFDSDDSDDSDDSE